MQYRGYRAEYCAVRLNIKVIGIRASAVSDRNSIQPL